MENKENCCGCTACVQACPQQCIKMVYDEEGFIYPEIDNAICIQCGICKNVCPFNKIDIITDEPIALAAFCKDNRIRYNSSSGGIFSILAQYIIKQNGVVFGAMFDSDTKKVKHKCVNTIEGIELFRGSKYIQSELNDSYKEAEKYLLNGEKVLFSGTSCQVAGLKSYLRKDYSNLICVEVICHGVPSLKLWNLYVDYIEKKNNKEFENIKFRSKKYSWENFGTNLTFNGKKDIFQFSFENPFFRLFNSNLCLRPSCYRCKVKGKNTKADISLGDFWHIDEVYPNLDDGKGISLVLLCTKKGKLLFDSISDDIKAFTDKIDYNIACKCNQAIVNSMDESNRRSDFFNDLETMNFECLEKIYSPKTWKIVLKGALLRTGIWKIIQKLRKNGGGVNNTDYGIYITFKN